MDVRLYGRKVEWMDGWTGAHLTPNHMVFLCPFPPSTSLRMETCNDKKSKKGFIFSFFFFIFFLPSKFELVEKNMAKTCRKCTEGIINTSFWTTR